MKSVDTSLHQKIYESWINKDGNVTTNEEIDDWIRVLNRNTKVVIKKIPLEVSENWYYDETCGEIRNKDRTFFTIKGYQVIHDNAVLKQQPIIVQNEIGYLGIICKEINGVLNFLMQAKIEPGNINKIQISPTIQATKSNFTQKHGGKKPKYLDYFVHADHHYIVVDQIQSEQSSRFYKKRNRNIIVKIEDEEVLVEKNFKWMTLGQIKRLMRIDNIVNMDTRTVLSCIPLYNHTLEMQELMSMKEKATDKALFDSIFGNPDFSLFPRMYQYINNIKMFNEEEGKFIPLNDLDTWVKENNEIVSTEEHDFKVIFCDIAIEGREVTRWTQPLFEATGIAVFALLTCKDEGVRKFLVKGNKEIGCHDILEFGPSIQIEPSQLNAKRTDLELLFFDNLNKKDCIVCDVLLSEEGGRFYHEQNRNIIMEVNKEYVHVTESDGYFWADYHTLNTMIQVNNSLNIQLRNLLSLLEV